MPCQRREHHLLSSSSIRGFLTAGLPKLAVDADPSYFPAHTRRAQCSGSERFEFFRSLMQGPGGYFPGSRKKVRAESAMAFRSAGVFLASVFSAIPTRGLRAKRFSCRA